MARKSETIVVDATLDFERDKEGNPTRILAIILDSKQGDDLAAEILEKLTTGEIKGFRFGEESVVTSGTGGRGTCFIALRGKSK